MKKTLERQTEIFSLAQRLGVVLKSRHFSCAVAESCTGGMIGAALTAVAGSSVWFKGGIIAYSNSMKQRLLSVDTELLTTYGAVSAETVTAMAEGGVGCTGAECSIAVSGIAGPGGGCREKPVGTVYIGICCNQTTTAWRHLFTGDRAEVRTATVEAALTHLLVCLQA